MDRVRKSDVNAAFSRLCPMLHKAQCQHYDDYTVGRWRLDYNALYGGYVVQEIFNEQGAITHPLGTTRMGGREFIDRVYWLAECLYALEKQRKVDSDGICDK